MLMSQVQVPVPPPDNKKPAASQALWVFFLCSLVNSPWIHTMTRCTPLPALALAAALALPLAAHAQQAPTPAGQRNFPPAALRGQLTVANSAEAQLNGQAVRLAPGLRIFNTDNALVFAHTLTGRPLTVNYVLEASTGMLLTAWLLTESEARQPRQGSDAVQSNIRTESGAAGQAAH